MMELRLWGLLHRTKGLDVAVIRWKAKQVKDDAAQRAGVPWSGLKAAGYSVVPVVLAYDSLAPTSEET